MTGHDRDDATTDDIDTTGPDREPTLAEGALVTTGPVVEPPDADTEDEAPAAEAEESASDYG